MQKVQIYVGSTRLDLFKDETISLTQSLKNVKQVDKIFTEFTQTFSVPASPTNNILFQHYYNFNIVLNSVNGFDARIKQPASIELNYIPFKTGFMRLDGVDLKRNKAYAYRITFFGETVNLKDILGSDQLDNLDLTTYDLTYDYDTVRGKMNVDTTSTDVVVPLITHTSPLLYDSGSQIAGSNNMYYNASTNQGVLWSELKYALRISKIVDAIQTKYLTPLGISFSDDFFNSTNEDYYGLFMWLHRKVGNVIPESQNVNEYNLPISSWVYQGAGTPTLQMNGDTTLQIGALYGTNKPASWIYEFSVSLTPVDTNHEYRFEIRQGGSSWYNSGIVTDVLNVTISDLPTDVTSSQYTFVITSQESTLEFSDVSLTTEGYYTPYGSTSTVTYEDDWSATSTGNIGISVNFDFLINEQIPEQKVIDFLTGLFKTFNLVAYYQNSQIVVQTYDDYFASLDEGLWNLQEEEWQDELRDWNEIGSTSSNVYSIDEFIDVNSSQVNVGLPYKQINFNYEGTGSFLAQQFNQTNNLVWGELRFTLNNQIYDAPSEIYEVKIPFEHMLFERLINQNSGSNTNLMYGYSVNETQQPYIGKPLIFYPLRQSQLTQVSVRDTSQHDPLSAVILPSNSVSLYSSISTSNINFNLEINEFSQDTSFSNTLFEKYYNNFISESFNTRRRLIRVKAFLPLNILYNLKLNNVIEINNQNYKINSMTTNFQTGETSFELINIL